MREVIVLGAGSFAREVTGLLNDQGVAVAFYVVDVEWDEKMLLGKPVMQLEEAELCWPAVCGMAVRERWDLLYKVLDLRWQNESVIHPSAAVDATVHVSQLSVVNRQASIGWGATLQTGVLVNRGATVGHDCVLEAGSTVGPGANLAGGVQLGIGAFVGMGANVREGVRVGENATVRMGAVVLNDVPDGETWWGVPARRVER